MPKIGESVKMQVLLNRLDSISIVNLSFFADLNLVAYSGTNPNAGFAFGKDCKVGNIQPPWRCAIRNVNEIDEIESMFNICFVFVFLF